VSFTATRHVILVTELHGVFALDPGEVDLGGMRGGFCIGDGASDGQAGEAVMPMESRPPATTAIAVGRPGMLLKAVVFRWRGVGIAGFGALEPGGVQRGFVRTEERV